MKYRPALRLIREHESLKTELAIMDARARTAEEFEQGILERMARVGIEDEQARETQAGLRRSLEKVNDDASREAAKAKRAYEEALAAIEVRRMATAAPFVELLERNQGARLDNARTLVARREELVAHRTAVRAIPKDRAELVARIAKLEAGNLLPQARARVAEIEAKERAKKEQEALQTEFMRRGSPDGVAAVPVVQRKPRAHPFMPSVAAILATSARLKRPPKRAQGSTGNGDVISIRADGR